MQKVCKKFISLPPQIFFCKKAQKAIVHTEKVQQLLCPQDFSLHFNFFRKRQCKSAILHPRASQFFSQNSFFSERDISFANMSWDNENRQKFTSNTAQRRWFHMVKEASQIFSEKKTIPKFKVSRRVHLMCQIYSSLLVKNCWTHQSVQKHFLLIRC